MQPLPTVASSKVIQQLTTAFFLCTGEQLPEHLVTVFVASTSIGFTGLLSR